MDILGYLASILIGISLGLIGGGGSILTVPVLVYLFGIEAGLATVYSLFVVGTTSAVGSITYFKKNLINIKTAAVFGIPSIAAVMLTRTYIVPYIPQEIGNIGSFILSKDILLMLLFAILMVLASYNMIKKNFNSKKRNTKHKNTNNILIFAQGAFVGFLTGLIGAGGGFLIIPVLANVLKMPIKAAIGTSLLIIAANSLLGFLFSLNQISIHWELLLSISAVAILGIFIGSFISSKIDGSKLKPAFGWFVLIMGFYIIIKETFLK